MKKENEKISRKTVKIIVAFFLCALLLATSFDLWGDKFLPASKTAESDISFSEKLRNNRIDKLKVHAKREEESVYTNEDIESAAEIIKEKKKKKEAYISLSRISFNEEKCNKIRDNSNQREAYNENNIIAFQCDYFVLKDFEAYSKGIYPGWEVVLARENENAPWVIIASGYA